MFDLINCGFNLACVLNICIRKKQYNINMKWIIRYYTTEIHTIYIIKHNTNTHNTNTSRITYRKMSTVINNTIGISTDNKDNDISHVVELNIIYTTYKQL